MAIGAPCNVERAQRIRVHPWWSDVVPLPWSDGRHAEGHALMAGVVEHHEPARSRTGDDSLLPGLCRMIPYRVYLPSPRWASPHTHLCRAVGCSHGGTSCPS